MAAPPLHERAWPFPLAKPAPLQLLLVYRGREPFTGEIATLAVTIRWQRRTRGCGTQVNRRLISSQVVLLTRGFRQEKSLMQLRYAPTFESGHGRSFVLSSASRGTKARSRQCTVFPKGQRERTSVPCSHGAPEQGAPGERDLSRVFSRVLRLAECHEVDKKPSVVLMRRGSEPNPAFNAAKPVLEPASVARFCSDAQSNRPAIAHLSHFWPRTQRTARKRHV